MFCDFEHAPRRDSLKIHFRDGELESPLAAKATLERSWIEGLSALGQPADLGDLEGELADARLQILGFESVGVPHALGAALVGRGPQKLRALDLHRFVEERLEGVRHRGKAILGEEFQDVVEDFRIGDVVGHAGLDWQDSNTNQESEQGSPLQASRRSGSCGGPATDRGASRRQAADHTHTLPIIFWPDGLEPELEITEAMLH